MTGEVGDETQTVIGGVARAAVAHYVHSDYRPLLTDYFGRACCERAGKHTPHLLDETLL
jgi:succinyl-CoA:acetate CoA-transferase